MLYPEEDSLYEDASLAAHPFRVTLAFMASTWFYTSAQPASPEEGFRCGWSLTGQNPPQRPRPLSLRSS